MKKETLIKKRHVLKVAFFSLTLLATVFLFVPKAKAAISEVCDYEDRSKLLRKTVKKSTYCMYKMFVNPGTDVSDTVGNIAVSAMMDVPLGVTMHTNADDIGLCGDRALIDEAEKNNIISEGDDYTIELETGATETLYSAEEIEEIKKQTENKNCNFNNSNVGDPESVSRIRGSLAGVATTVYGNVTTEPPPVNLAYYTKHNLQKIPVVNNTAFAQTSIYDSFGLRMFMSIWEVSRRIAYAMLSIIMIVIGIMISTGRKINPQTVVTAQTALPRIVISLVLITFSYPIGAVLVSSALPITFTALKIFLGQFLEDLGSTFGGQEGQLVNFNIWVTVGAVLIGMFGSGGVGAILVILMLVLTVVAVFVVGVKLLIINVKMLLQIVMAPIQFAIAAIPGQEHIIKDWFKQMIAKVLAIPAMVLTMALAWYVILTPFTNLDSLAMLAYSQFSSVTQFYNAFGVFSSLQPQGNLQVFATITTSFVLLCMVSMMIMFMSLKVDKKVEEFIMGGKPGGRR